MNKTLGDIFVPSMGLPQGSFLSLFVFFIYMRPLCQTESVKCKYVDDSTPLNDAKSLSCCLRSAENFCTKRRLVLKCWKTEHISLGSAEVTSEYMFVDKSKILGLLIDQNLYFKLNPSIVSVSRVKFSNEIAKLNEQGLNTFYVAPAYVNFHAHLSPRITYGMATLIPNSN